MGLTAAGASIGGTVFPIAARKLIPIVGYALGNFFLVTATEYPICSRFPWTMRIIGFILLFSLSLPNVTLRRRLPPKHVAGGLFNLQAFKSAPFSVYCLASFSSFLGLYTGLLVLSMSLVLSYRHNTTVLTYIDVSALSVGVSPDFSFYLVSIANGASLFGRLSTGIAVDMFGVSGFSHC